MHLLAFRPYHCDSLNKLNTHIKNIQNMIDSLPSLSLMLENDVLFFKCKFHKIVRLEFQLLEPSRKFIELSIFTCERFI